MTTESTLMHREAAQAGGVVRQQLEHNGPILDALVARLRAQPPPAVITCARGSSDHAATFAKYLLETRLGVLTASAAPSVSSVYFTPQNLNGCLFLAISQSGASPDILAAAAAAQRAGALVVAMVNVLDSPLARAADFCLPLHAGEERSVAATKSFIASLTAIIALVGRWAADDAIADALAQSPGLLEQAWRLDWQAALPLFSRSDNLFIMGRGLGLGIAYEAALKCKETCGLHAEGFSSAEVQHGPQALLGVDFPALLLAQQDETLAGIRQVAIDLAARGVPLAVAGCQVPEAISLPTLSCHPVIQPMLLIQSFYRLANAVAVSRGFNPDQPAHLRKVTETT